MIPENPREVAMLLLGGVYALGLAFVVAAVAVWFGQWRAAWREGTPIDGEGLERAKRRGDLP